MRFSKKEGPGEESRDVRVIDRVMERQRGDKGKVSTWNLRARATRTSGHLPHGLRTSGARHSHGSCSFAAPNRSHRHSEDLVELTSTFPCYYPIVHSSQPGSKVRPFLFILSPVISYQSLRLSRSCQQTNPTTIQPGISFPHRSVLLDVRRDSPDRSRTS